VCASESPRKNGCKEGYLDRSHALCESYTSLTSHSERIICNKSSESITNFKCLATTVMNQNFIHAELLVKIDSANARFHSFFN
jgi:hypothetical protein